MPHTVATHSRRRAAPRRATFTPWRILVLLLIGPVTAVTVAVTLYLAPARPMVQPAKPGQLPVVEYTHAPVVTR